MSTQNSHLQLHWQRSIPRLPEEEHLIHPPLHLSSPRDCLVAQYTLHPVCGELQTAHALCCNGEPHPCSTPDTLHAPNGYYIACSLNIPGFGVYNWNSGVCYPHPLARDVPKQPQAPQEPAQHHGHAADTNTLKRKCEDAEYLDATGRKIPRTDGYAATAGRARSEEVYGVGSDEGAIFLEETLALNQKRAGPVPSDPAFYEMNRTAAPVVHPNLAPVPVKKSPHAAAIVDQESRRYSQEAHEGRTETTTAAFDDAPSASENEASISGGDEGYDSGSGNEVSPHRGYQDLRTLHFWSEADWKDTWCETGCGQGIELLHFGPDFPVTDEVIRYIAATASVDDKMISSVFVIRCDNTSMLTDRGILAITRGFRALKDVVLYNARLLTNTSILHLLKRSSNLRRIRIGRESERPNPLICRVWILERTFLNQENRWPRSFMPLLSRLDESPSYPPAIAYALSLTIPMFRLERSSMDEHWFGPACDAEHALNQLNQRNSYQLFKRKPYYYSWISGLKSYRRNDVGDPRKPAWDCVEIHI